jgi:menaquinone-dependent protoporphyrinogen oxidase
MTRTKLSRRRFFKVVGLTAGGSALACCGLGFAASQSAAPASPPAPVETPSFTFGKDDAVNTHILVTYATRTGMTTGVASAIGECLAENGFTVDVKPINDHPDPAKYQAVVIGCAVNGAKWLPEAVQFVERHQKVLGQMPVAVFCVHILNLGSDKKSQKNRLAYLDPVRALIQPVDEGYFAGFGLDPQKTSPILRWLFRTTKFMPEGDCRDFAAIRGWGTSLAQTLSKN